MVKGINCVIWNIQGKTATKTLNAQMKDSIIYVLNEEKTDCVFDMKDSPINDIEGQLGRECQYVENDIKTFHGALVGGVNVISTEPQDAVREMLEVKKFYNKLDGRAALHGVLTLDEAESDISNAAELMKVCEEVLKELFPNHQAIFAVHTNTDNLHVHFIVNSVGINGTKIHQPKHFVEKTVHPVVNQAAMKHGFTPNIKWGRKSATITSYVELKMQLRQEIDLAIENASDFEGFVKNLRENGLIVNVGKYISIGIEELPKAVRTYQLGFNYTKDAIVERIKTRKNSLQSKQVSNFTSGEETEVLVSPVTAYMKNYKEMDEEERKNVVSLLRLGQNPWKRTRQRNWQMEELANQVNNVYRATELIKYYSSAGMAQEALDKILENKKKISEEKKQIRADLKSNKIIIDIYKEMKAIEKKAYLFDLENVPEFEEDYKRYRELTKRLKNGYNKTFSEVAAYVDSCNEQILYSHAQLHQLSNEYKEIRKYAKEYGNLLNDKETMLEAVGLNQAKQDDKKEIHTAEIFYVVSKSSEVMLQVIKGVEADKNGRLHSTYQASVINHYGEVLETVAGNVMDKNLYQQLKKIETKYDFEECEKMYSHNKAQEWLKVKHKEVIKRMDESGGQLKEKIEPAAAKKTYSFSQAINLQSVKGENGYHIILNNEKSSYMAIVYSNDKSIRVQVVDRSGKLQRQAELPAVKGKTPEGYETIISLQKEYGFSDTMISVKNMEEAKEYMHHPEETEYAENSIYK